MAIPKDIKNPGLNEWSILVGYRGSIAHGMYTPDSIDDKDVMSICVPPIEYYYGLREYGSKGTQEIKRGEWDIVIYEAKKFFALLAQGNPNVLSMLWMDKKNYLKTTPAGELLIQNRDIFTGRHVYRSFTGYAHGQLYRMTHGAFNGYMGEKRKALVDKFGYDTKNAAHLIRLLRMGTEFLKDGVMYVEREDSSQLLEIKRGEWPLERVKSESDKLFAMAQEAYIHSTLKAGPRIDEVSGLCIRVISEAIGR
jgi:predicted nucleotidyltransferase